MSLKVLKTIELDKIEYLGVFECCRSELLISWSEYSSRRPIKSIRKSLTKRRTDKRRCKKRFSVGGIVITQQSTSYFTGT